MTIHSIPSLRSRAMPIWGRATFTIVVSRMTMNVPIRTTPIATHG